MRKMSAFQSKASASREPAFRHPGNHWMPWLLMPRSWIRVPPSLQRPVPQTRSWPWRETGEPLPGVGVARAVVGLGVAVDVAVARGRAVAVGVERGATVAVGVAPVGP